MQTRSIQSWPHVPEWPLAPDFPLTGDSVVQFITNFCQIYDVKQEIMLRRADDRAITVLPGENYPGFLANVEGANRFVTRKARTELSKHGVAIVKDSSANKCGVICSSMEILAGMLVSEEQFLEIRSAYITEVVDLLRNLARIEAICLFNEHRRQPQQTLPEISVLISHRVREPG